MKLTKHKHKLSKWITNGIIKSIKFKDKLHWKLKNTHPESFQYELLQNHIRNYSKILKRSIRVAKKMFYFSAFNKCKYDIKNTWSLISGILNKTKNKQDLPEQFLINGEHVSDKSIIANQFNNFFINIGSSAAEQIPNTDGLSYKKYLTHPTRHTFMFSLTDEKTVNAIIRDMKPKTSCGYDGLSTKLLKFIEPEITKAVTFVINQSLMSGIFPTNLKVAKVIPLFKKNNPALLDNYRPISLLPAVSKIFERVIFDQLHNYFSIHKLYYKSQYGFRKQHSTELAALELIDLTIKKLEKGEIPISIFLDLSKAFDTINHDILLKNLEYYGIRRNKLNLFQSYLCDRKQYVEFQNSQSDQCKITTGVPQGSILGPLLFIIYINDFHKASKIFEFIIYADDTTLTSTLNNFN